jgi:hypothetical protein
MRESTNDFPLFLLLKSLVLAEQCHPEHEFADEIHFPSQIHFAAGSFGDDAFV